MKSKLLLLFFSLAVVAQAQLERVTSSQTITDTFKVTAKADPGTPAAGEVWLSTTTANTLKYRSGGTTYSLATLADLSGGYQPLNSSLTAISGGTWTGASSITTLGTIATGTWHGTAIDAARGGFGSDISASSGVPLFSAGTATFTSTIGTGNFVRATSPTLVTPTIGVATATSLALTNGATITDPGTGGLALTAAGSNQDVKISLSGTGDLYVLKNTAVSTPWFDGVLLTGADATNSGWQTDVYGAQARFDGRRANGTKASPTGLVAADPILTIGARGYTSSGSYSGTAGSIIFKANESWSSTALGNYIEFNTVPDATSTQVMNAVVGLNRALTVGASSSWAAWTTGGVALGVPASTWTNRTSSGTVASIAINAFGVPTIASSSVTTFTNAANVYIAGDAVGTGNATVTNGYGLWNVGKTRLDGTVYFGGSSLSNISDNGSGQMTIASASGQKVIITSTGATTDFTTSARVISPSSTQATWQISQTAAATWQWYMAAGSSSLIFRDASNSADIITYGGGRISYSPRNWSTIAWGTLGAINVFGASTVTDSSTAASGTAATAVFHSFAAPTLAATNASVTTTNAATLYIAGDVVNGTNQTITNSYGFWNVGKTRLDGVVNVTNTTEATTGAAGAVISLGGIYSGKKVVAMGGLLVDKTVTAGGTTGDQTINKPAGTVNFAASATSLVVTNSLVTTSSIIICTVGTNDTTMKSVVAVAGSGSFTLYANAAATAETRVNFHVIN